MHKRNYDLTSGACLNDDSYGIIPFQVKVDGEDLSLLLPDEGDLDAVIGTSKWMVRQATAELLSKTAESTVEIVGPSDAILTGEPQACGGGTSCGDAKLDW